MVSTLVKKAARGVESDDIFISLKTHILEALNLDMEFLKPAKTIIKIMGLMSELNITAELLQSIAIVVVYDDVPRVSLDDLYYVHVLPSIDSELAF